MSAPSLAKVLGTSQNLGGLQTPLDLAQGSGASTHRLHDSQTSFRPSALQGAPGTVMWFPCPFRAVFAPSLSRGRRTRGYDIVPVARVKFRGSSGSWTTVTYDFRRPPTSRTFVFDIPECLASGNQIAMYSTIRCGWQRLGFPPKTVSSRVPAGPGPH